MVKAAISVVAVLLAAVVGVVAPQQVPSPYEVGPHDTFYLHIGSLFTVGLEENLDVWVPAEPGTYKVFFFIDGLGGVFPAQGYTQMMERIASHGIAVVAPWKLTAPINPDDKVSLFISVMEWVEAHLESKLYKNGLSEDVHLDFDNLMAGSHSAGAHVFVEYLKTTCGKFKAQVFLSPVDGVDAAGIIPIFCITPGQTLNYAIPTLHLHAGLDSVGGFSNYSCAPDFLSNDRFFDALDPSEPRWSINATKFGHVDFMDPEYLQTIMEINFCSYSHEATQEEFADYRRYEAGQIVAFFKAVFESRDECHSYLTYLEDPDVMLVSTTEHHDRPSAECPEARCSWWPQPETTKNPL